MGHLGVTKKFFCLSQHFYDYFYDWGWKRPLLSDFNINAFENRTVYSLYSPGNHSAQR
jgi:hypothetical protein